MSEERGEESKFDPEQLERIRSMVGKMLADSPGMQRLNERIAELAAEASKALAPQVSEIAEQLSGQITVSLNTELRRKMSSVAKTMAQTPAIQHQIIQLGVAEERDEALPGTVINAGTPTGMTTSGMPTVGLLALVLGLHSAVLDIVKEHPADLARSGSLTLTLILLGMLLDEFRRNP